MPAVPGLRSPYAPVGRLLYFGRMLDKIRLHAAGRLPPDWVANLGETRPPLFDARCCRFLGVTHAALQEKVLAGGADEEILAWVEHTTPRRTDEECMIWNRFMTKLGWRDDRTEPLQQRITQHGLAGRGVETFFDLIEMDEGREAKAGQPWLHPRPLSVLVVMGVSGSGKSTVGGLLAERLGWEFADADSFHSEANVAKMKSGQPLTDEDRAPWLASLARHLDEKVAQGAKVVLACSALRDRYRQALVPDLAHTRFILLHGDPAVIQARLENRSGHFMGASLLPSQLSTLEKPLDALTVDLSLSPDESVNDIRHRFWL